MFDNIIGHQNLIEQFRSDIGGGTLPRVLLFHGDPYSGKLTAALEMARVLTCTGGSGNSAGASGAGAIKGGLRGEWGCGCRSCSAQRLLLHQSTLILGIRPFMEEITATAEILKRHRKQFAQFLFLRSVRKLTRRFDPLLWEGQETRLKKSLSALEAVEEDLELIAPGKELPADSILEERLNRIVKNCADIISGFGSDNIPVNQIRRVSFWSHTTTPGENLFTMSFCTFSWIRKMLSLYSPLHLR